MPAELKLLMRHASIETTMKYYVGIAADDIAAGLWARFSKVEKCPQIQLMWPMDELTLGLLFDRWPDEFS